MELFAIDQNQAEQAVRTPSSETSTSSRTSPAPGSTTPRQTVVPSSEDTEGEGPSVPADTTSDNLFGDEKIRYRGEVHKYSPGWPRFAATEESWYNGGVYRRFGWLGSRLLLYKQGRLDSLQQQLEEHEADAATDARGLSAGQTCRVGETHTPDRLDLIMEEIGKELRNYWGFLTGDRDTQALIKALEGEVVHLYEHVARHEMINGAASHPAYEISDFVYTRPKLAHDGLRWLLYSRRAERLFRRPIFAGRQLSSAAVMLALQVLAVSFGVLMLLCPTGLMYLLEPGKAASYGLTVGFAVVFAVAFGVADASFEHVLLGTCAYVAVLSDILVQTQGGGGGGV